jgi:hypothetical protein
VAEWFSIEVLHGSSSANTWVDAFGDQLVNAAFGEGATDWLIQRLPWGVVLELELADDTAFERFRALPVIVAALDGVPDPVNGLLVHRGRGGSSGSRRPRRPTPLRGSGAASLPIPVEHAVDELVREAIFAPRSSELAASRSRIA